MFARGREIFPETSRRAKVLAGWASIASTVVETRGSAVHLAVLGGSAGAFVRSSVISAPRAPFERMYSASSVCFRIFGADDAARGTKRLSPGAIVDREGEALVHDASTLPGSSGACIVDFESREVIGVHVSGSYKDRKYLAIPLHQLAADPQLLRFGVAFSRGSLMRAKAIVIGIDRYPVADWCLDGAVRDALAFEIVVVGHVGSRSSPFLASSGAKPASSRLKAVGLCVESLSRQDVRAPIDAVHDAASIWN